MRSGTSVCRVLVERYFRVAEADDAEITGKEIRAEAPPGLPGPVLLRGKQFANSAGHLRIIELGDEDRPATLRAFGDDFRLALTMQEHRRQHDNAFDLFAA